jgi:hypothetical protein
MRYAINLIATQAAAVEDDEDIELPIVVNFTYAGPEPDGDLATWAVDDIFVHDPSGRAINLTGTDLDTHRLTKIIAERTIDWQAA